MGKKALLKATEDVALPGAAPANSNHFRFKLLSGKGHLSFAHSPFKANQKSSKTFINQLFPVQPYTSSSQRNQDV